jgi:hypothetical protein
MTLLAKHELPPGDEGVCPITMEKYEVADVDFLPGARIDPNHPEACAGMLPCGHVFGAVAILHHMASTTMQCPMCRAGPDCKLDARSIPDHLRADIVRKRDRMERDGIDEQQREDAAMIFGMLRESAGPSYQEVDVMLPGVSPEMIPVEITVYFYQSLADVPDPGPSHRCVCLPDRHVAVGYA